MSNEITNQIVENSLNELLTIQEHIFENMNLNTESNTELNTESNTELNTESNTELNTESNTELNTESNLNHFILEPIHSMNIYDSIHDFNEKINDYRNIEHKILINNDSNNTSIKSHILIHLENQIDLIEENFEKITHKQFDKIVDKNDIYNKELNKELENILGFSLEDYNKQSIKIEECINKICEKINNSFNELRNYIYNLHVLNQKLNFISNYENQTLEKSFFELVDKYEKNIKNNIENELNKNIKNKIENIHNLFNMLKILQSQLYVKVVTKYSCGICLHNNIDLYYNNCGHVICKSCGIKNRNTNICPFCKQESLLKPLFFI